MATKQDVIRALFTLSVTDQLEIHRLLNDELDGVDVDDDPAVSEAWVAELERRIAEVESGRSLGRPWEDVLHDLRHEALNSAANASHHP